MKQLTNLFRFLFYRREYFTVHPDIQGKFRIDYLEKCSSNLRGLALFIDTSSF